MSVHPSAPPPYDNQYGYNGPPAMQPGNTTVYVYGGKQGRDAIFGSQPQMTFCSRCQREVSCVE
jgi:hypothetical protein